MENTICPRCGGILYSGHVCHGNAGPAWQPLSTAPKDGTSILICRAGRGHEPFIVWWAETHWTADCAGDVDGLLQCASGVLWHELPEMPKTEV